MKRSGVNRKQSKEDDDDEVGEEGAVAASQPSFRFAQLRTEHVSEAHLVSTTSSLKPPPVAEVIDKASFFLSDSTLLSDTVMDDVDAAKSRDVPSNWNPMQLRPVPAFYPLEKSSRLVEDDSAVEIAGRVSDCLRNLSVQADYDNETATATLLTSENVEMYLSLWKTQSGSQRQGVVVELQRRKGDSIAFHRYSRSILDAAVGDLDTSLISIELLEDMKYSKKVQRLIAMELRNQEHMEHENAIIAIEIARGLLMKDRMDARQLGLESLCLLTDPRKTGFITAILASHVVLLGSTQGVHIPGVTDNKSSEIIADDGPFQEIRETILSLVQFSRISEDDDVMDESADQEHITLLHNLALAVLANALEMIENPDSYDGEPEDTKPRARLRTSSSTDVANEFMQQSEHLSKKEILSTLISELGKAHQKPHNATLSAKCIGSLCRASDEAKRRAKELGAKNVVSTALDVGVRTHLKLETECKNVVKALERRDEEDDEQA